MTAVFNYKLTNGVNYLGIPSIYIYKSQILASQSVSQSVAGLEMIKEKKVKTKKSASA